ncbi:MAG: hypothetical protein JW829_02765 [Pirellulales bacterium]|nr:hypothetical protein [Pirellulales bacterium]
MKSERKRDTSQKAHVARARMYMKAHLHWLCGFPVDQSEDWIEWAHFRLGRPAPLERVRLGRYELRKAQFAMTKLVRRFPRAIVRIVDDVDTWSNRVARLLDQLKDAIHHHQPLLNPVLAHDACYPAGFVKQAATIRRHWPALQSLVEAIAWIFYLSPKDSAQSLNWVEKNASLLSTFRAYSGRDDDLTLLLALWSIARHDGESRLETLISLLGDERVYSVPTEGLDSYRHTWMAENLFRQVRAARSKPLTQDGCCEDRLKRPEPTFGLNLLAFLDWLMTQSKKSRCMALDLLAAVVPEGMFALCEETWSTIEKAVAPATQLWIAFLKGNRLARRRLVDSIVDVTQALQRLDRQPMARIRDSLLLTTIREVSHPRYFPVAQQLLSSLKAVPDLDGKRLIRPALFVSLYRALANQYHINASRSVGILQIFEKYFVKHDKDVNALMPWNDIISTWNSIYEGPKKWSSRINWYLLSFNSIRHVQLLLDVFARLGSEEGFWDTCTDQNMDLIFYIVISTRDYDRSIAYFHAAVSAKIANINYYPDIVECAVDLAADSTEFCKLLSLLQDKMRFDFDFPSRIDKLIKEMADIGGRDLFIDFLADTPWRSLGDLEKRLQLIRDLGFLDPILSRPQVLVRPNWIDRYPVELGRALKELATIIPDAERLASRILDKHFPSPTRLARDIAITEELLGKRPDNTKLAKRLENLKKRQAVPQPHVSETRLTRLKLKIEHRARLALLETWHQQADQVLRRVVRELLQIDEIPDYLLEEDNQILVSEIVMLEGPFRELGLRLLRRRCGLPPWTFNDEPANVQFINQLCKQGIHLESWLNPAPSVLMTGQDGQPINLALETDPIEILRMGQYFDTCLSPGGGCFFSTIANAIDANKRVLYGRNLQGTVVARCLLALTTEGKLITFHPYCYDPSLDFPGILAKFVVELSRKMNTTIVHRGRISKLVAPRWYNDGPVDIWDQFECLKEGSSFRAALSHIPLDQFITEVQAAFEPLPLNELTIPHVIELEEFDIRPELIIPLLPYIDKCRFLEASTLCRAVNLIQKVGSEESVGNFVMRHVPRHLIRHLMQISRFDCQCMTSDTNELLNKLVDINPSVALRVLRATRPKGVRSDESETNPNRREALARAHALLGRLKRSKRLKPQYQPEPDFLSHLMTDL